MPKKEIITEIGGRKLKLSNLDKVLYPEVGLVKAELIQYYMNISSYILPHLVNRPLTLIRYPDGVDGKRFYSKNRPSWTPEWIDDIKLSADDHNKYIMANDVPSLIWLANLAALEIHPMQITSQHLISPDHFIFDLDPPAVSKFEVVKSLALRLKPFLESYGYSPFIKTSGSKGLHIYVPIHPIYDQVLVLECVKKLAAEYIKTDKSVTLKLNKEKRKGKILLDIYRNHKSQTCVAPYSTRGKKGAPISAPLYWEELKLIKSSQAFTINTILQKLELDGDPWRKFMTEKTYLHNDKSKAKVSTKHRKKNKTLDQPKSSIQSIDIKPMLAVLGKSIPKNNKYDFEIKWDGIRIVIKKDRDKVNIYTRNGNDLTEKFPIITQSIKTQVAENFIVDGELMVFNKNGTPNFSKIVGRMHLNGSKSILNASKKDAATVILFDLIYINNKDLRSMTLEQRRERLKNYLFWNESIKFSENFEDGEQLFEAIKAKQMEGIMCKLKGSRYESNTRSTSWIKIKVQNEDEALIIGYTKGKGDRSQLFGALHLAKLVESKYIYFGKVGTGFSGAKMNEISSELLSVKQIKKPIDNAVEDEKNTIWIKPDYSCKLKYASMSSNQTYREPVFINMYLTNEKL